MKSFYTHTKLFKRSNKKEVKVKVNVNFYQGGIIWTYGVWFKQPWDHYWLAATHNYHANAMRKLSLRERKKLVRDLNLNHVSVDEVIEALQEAWVTIKPIPREIIFK